MAVAFWHHQLFGFSGGRRVALAPFRLKDRDCYRAESMVERKEGAGDDFKHLASSSALSKPIRKPFKPHCKGDCANNDGESGDGC